MSCSYIGCRRSRICTVRPAKSAVRSDGDHQSIPDGSGLTRRWRRMYDVFVDRMRDESAIGRPGRRVRGRNLTGGLVDDLKEIIRSGSLKPGERLPTELVTMAKYGVSRTVVREAISGLQTAGLVRTMHGIGTFVAETAPDVVFRLEPASRGTVSDILAMLEFRIGLESEAAALAAMRRTDAQLELFKAALEDYQSAYKTGGDSSQADYRFHLLIAEASGNQYFTDILAHLGTSAIPRTRVAIVQSPESKAAYLAGLSREHEQIYGGILCADAQLASKFMRIHLSNSRERFRVAQERLQESSG